jgi:hypothetical protein
MVDAQYPIITAIHTVRPPATAYLAGMDGAFQEIHALPNPTSAITEAIILGAQPGHLHSALLAKTVITLVQMVSVQHPILIAPHTVNQLAIV